MMLNDYTKTISFVIRLTQTGWADAQGKPHIQWRGRIQGVQDGQDAHFTDFSQAIAFIQQTVWQQTINNFNALEEVTMDKEKLFQESFKLWEQFATNYTSLMVDTMTETVKQSETFKGKMQEAFEQSLKTWQPPFLGQQTNLQQEVADLQKQVEDLTTRVKTLEGKKGK